MKRIIAIVITMLALCAGMAVVSPVSAAPAGTERSVGAEYWWDCPDGYFCAWYLENGEGEPRFVGQVRAPDLREFRLNDHVWSVWNRTGVTWCAYPDINFSDINGSAAPNPWPVGNWQGNTSQYNRQNVISSLRRGVC